MTELNVDLPMFQFNKEETVVKGDQVLSDGRRVVMFSTNYHLKLLAKTEEALADGTFRTTPPPWKQSFIISAKVTSDVFVPCIFVLLPTNNVRVTMPSFPWLRKTWSAGA